MSYSKAEAVNRSIAGQIYGLTFDVGQVEELNTYALTTGRPLCWFIPRSYNSQPIAENTNRMQDNHIIELLFVKQGAMSLDNEERFQLIKDMDSISTNFKILMQDFAETNEVSVNSFVTNPAYFTHAKNLFTGVLLTYNLVMPDDFEYC